MKKLVLALVALVVLASSAFAEDSYYVMRDGKPMFHFGSDAYAKRGLWGGTEFKFLTDWEALKAANPELGPNFVVTPGTEINVPPSWNVPASAFVNATPAVQPATPTSTVVEQTATTPFLPKWFMVLLLVTIGLIAIATMALRDGLLARQPIVNPPAPAPQPAPVVVNVNTGGNNQPVNVQVQGAQGNLNVTVQVNPAAAPVEAQQPAQAAPVHVHNFVNVEAGIHDLAPVPADNGQQAAAEQPPADQPELAPANA